MRYRPSFLREDILCWNKKSILRCTCMLFLLYVPYLLIFFPCVCNWDTLNQLNDYFTGTQPLAFSWIPGQETVSCFLNDHHPVFTTFVFTRFYLLGRAVGKVNLGMYLYTGLQTLAGAGLFSTMLCAMEKLRIRTVYRKAGFLFLGLMPVVPMYLVCVVKDSLFSVFFVAYLLLYVVLVLRPATGKRLAALLVLSLLLALTKKTGIYLILFSNAGLLLKEDVRRMWKAWLPSLAAPAILLFAIMPKLIFPALDIWPGGRQEMLSPCIQQVARCVVDHGEEIPDEDRDVIGRIIDYREIPEIFEPESIDAVKNTYHLHATRSEQKQFLKLWLRYVGKYPASCAKAVLDIVRDYFLPVDGLDIYTHIPDHSWWTWDSLHQPQRLGPARDFVKHVYERVSTLPVIKLVFRVAIYASWIPVFAVIRILRRRDRRAAVAMIPVVLSVLVLLISPIPSTRYMLPLLFVTPLVVGLSAREVHIL